MDSRYVFERGTYDDGKILLTYREKFAQNAKDEDGDVIYEKGNNSNTRTVSFYANMIQIKVGNSSVKNIISSYIFEKYDEVDELSEEKLTDCDYKIKEKLRNNSYYINDKVVNQCGSIYSYDELCELEIDIDITLDSGEEWTVVFYCDI